MIKITMALILICALNVVSANQITRPNKLFGMTADDMLKMVISDGQIEKMERDRKTLNIFQKVMREYNNTPKFDNSTFTPRRSGVQVTPLPTSSKPSVDLEAVKEKVKKMRVMKMLKDNKSLLPAFESGGDDPNMLTRRFDEMLEHGNIKYNSTEPKDALRQIYLGGDYNHWYVNPRTIRENKDRVISIMRQFIYMTRYKMSIMTLLRKKYMNHIKYKMGYLFALARLVQYQQQILFSTVARYRTTWRNPIHPMRFYEKMMRLDTDLKDLVKYILRLNYDMKLFYDPTYYDDSHEPGPFANISNLKG